MPPLKRIKDRYELQGEVGEGGMGVVWRALDVKTGSQVAIKLMKDVSDPVAIDLFTKESRTLAAICHPNIVEVLDVDVIEENGEERPFFVMPLLSGETLAELIAEGSARLTVERVVEIAAHVCRGLQAAHQQGLIHRDLKPSNILVMDDDSAKILDFGVVDLAGSNSTTELKENLQYMSPEQAQMKEITPASDLFSMGVILYEALTRRKPFARSTVRETVDAVIKCIPPPVCELNPNANLSLSRVVHKCLAKRPVHRFASARDLADTLQKALRNEPVFDSAKIEQRIECAETAYKPGDEAFSSEILAELEVESHLDPSISVLRTQIDMTVRATKTRQLLENARARMVQDEIPLALDKIREVLELDPGNADALALRKSIEKQRSESQIEDAERQELSAYIAELSKRLEAERDPDARINILREACDHYPNEIHFAQQLKVLRERSDLVNSIVVKARQYEERGQHAEAISQWEILRSIHPDYPGIALEMEQCKKKRDLQGRDEERSRLINEIDGLIDSRLPAPVQTRTPSPGQPILGPFRISIAHPRTLSKGFNSKIVVVLYLSDEHKQVRQVLRRDFSDDSRKVPQRYTETRDTTSIQSQTRVQVDLFSQAIEFSQTVSLELLEPLNCARFLAKPREDCRIGEHQTKVVIRDCSTGSERYSGFIQIKVVDYLFDHVSRPFFSRCTSIVLTAGSLVTFLLTILGKLDQTLGLTSGATALLLGSALFGNLFKGYISHTKSLPSP
jgi:serine/threonine protein kinase